MGVSNMNKHRRHGQGMTEYVLLVGLIALLLLAAVNKFGFAVDEAIQGSANAFILHHPAESYHADSGGPGHVSLGRTDKGHTVYAVARKTASGGYEWVQVVDSTSEGGTVYDEATHGRISSRS